MFTGAAGSLCLNYSFYQYISDGLTGGILAGSLCSAGSSRAFSSTDKAVKLVFSLEGIQEQTREILRKLKRIPWRKRVSGKVAIQTLPLQGFRLVFICFGFICEN